MTQTNLLQQEAKALQKLQNEEETMGEKEERCKKN